MLKIFRDAIGAGTDALESTVEFAERRFRRLGIQVAMLVGLAVAGGLAACAVLAGVVVLLVPLVGLGVALLIVGGAMLVGAAVAFGLIQRAGRTGHDRTGEGDAIDHPAVDHPRLPRPANTSRGPRPSNPAARTGHTGTDTPADFIEDAVAHAISHPGILAGTAFAAVSVLGLRRSMRLLRTASAVASAGAVASQFVASIHEHNGHVKGEGERVARVRR